MNTNPRQSTRVFVFACSLMLFGACLTQAQTGPTISQQPTNQIAILGTGTAFGVAVSGTGPFSYQWQLNGTNFPSAIATVAGDGSTTYPGNNFAATNVGFYQPSGVAVDSYGNLFIADTYNHAVREVSNGIITTVAGNGLAGYSGDGGAATNAELNEPEGVAVDAYGNLFISDTSSQCIRKVGTNGIITTIAGDGIFGFSGDGGAATNAELNGPACLAVDGSGDVFFADSANNRIREVTTNGIIFTVAGNGSNGYSGDGVLATNTSLYGPYGVAVDAFGNLYIADSGNQRIRLVGTNGIISTFAGDGSAGYSGDGGAATNANFDYPYGIALDNYGNLFITDNGNFRIREVTTSALVITVAGDGGGGFAGDGGAATNALLNNPLDVAVDNSGNLYIVESYNYRIREVTPNDTPTLLLYDVTAADAGNFDVVVSNASGSITSSVAALTVLLPPTLVTQPASQTVGAGSNATLSATAAGTAPLSYQWLFDGAAMTGQTNASLTLDTVLPSRAGSYAVVVSNLYGTIESKQVTLTVLLITTQPQNQTVTVGSNVTFQVGVTASAQFTYQWYFDGVAMTGQTNSNLAFNTAALTNSGSYLVVVSNNLYGSATSSVVTLSAGYPPVITSQPQSQASLVGTNASFHMAATGTGPLTFQWQFSGTNLPGGIISTVAGTGTGGYSGDGGQATNAKISNTYGLAVDGSGNIFIADTSNYRVRKVATNGVITTVAGNGSNGYAGDGGAATNAKLSVPYGLALDSFGDVLMADMQNNRIRMLGTNGLITTVAGDGFSGFGGDGRAATNTTFSQPQAVAVDSDDNLLICDTGDSRIRVDTFGVVVTVAGGGQSTAGGGGSALNARLERPDGVALDSHGNFFFTDSESGLVCMVNDSGIITILAGGGTQFPGDGGLGTNARLGEPAGVAVDSAGNLFFADTGYGRIRRVNTNGIISTVAGGGGSYPGDGLPATNAELSNPFGIALDASNNLYFTDGEQYRIRKVALPGPMLSLNSPANANAGNYDVVVSSPYGSVTSSVAVLEEITMTQQPKSQTNAANTAITLDAFALSAGTTPPNPILTYQWQFNGSNIAGATKSTYNPPSAVTNSGAYDAVVIGPAGSVTSSVANVVFYTPPGFTSQPHSQTVVAGNTATFSAVVNGTGPFTYQWYFNNALMPGRTNIPLSITNVASTNAGTYIVEATSPYALGESIAAILTVVLPPQNFTASLMAGPAALFQLSGSPGVNYVLQATTNLASPSSWLPVFTNAAGANGSWSFTDTNVPLNPQMFYRALLP